MKQSFLVILSSVFFLTSLISQSFDWEDQTPTHAVVIGISDYLDEKRTDLNYAHRDAEVFAEFLQSKSGGNVPVENIKLLTNELATLAAIDDALDWLVEKTDSAYRAILYFSGHGDVEKQTLWQLGYLLAYDTPFNNYRNNAVRLEDLNDIITTLSVGKEAEVMVITDACRSGNLAGTNNRGPSLTSEQLAKQAANEARIMSCKPDQKSYESAIWGGGRGVFSWHFINGLKGLANDDNQPEITREEIEFYLKVKFKEEQKNNTLKKRQTPQFTGNELFKLSKVDQDELAALEIELNPPMMAAAVASMAVVEPETITGRGGDEEIEEEEADEPKKGMGSPFDIFVNKTLDDAYYSIEIASQLFEYINEPFDSALGNRIDNTISGFSFHQKSQRPKVFISLIQTLIDENVLSQNFKNQLAIAVHNKAQRAINKYLRGDNSELERRELISWGEEYSELTSFLALAEQLLEPTHTLVPKIKIKHQYFEGVHTRLKAVTADDYEAQLQKAIAQQEKALQLDDKAPYVHNELGLLYQFLWVHSGFENQTMLETSKKHLDKAIELSPTWVIPYSNLGAMYAQMGDIAQAKKILKKALDLNPDYFGSHVNIGYSFESENNYLRAETYYREAMDLASAHYLPFDRLAYLSVKMGDYHLADSLFKEAEDRRNGLPVHMASSYSVLSAGDKVVVYVDYPSLEWLLERLAKDSLDIEAHYLIGQHYVRESEYELAEKHFKTVLKLDPNHPYVCNDLGMMFFKLERYEEAEVLFQRLVEMYPDSTVLFFKLADLYGEWSRFDSEEKIYLDIIEKSRGVNENYSLLIDAYKRMWPLLEKLGRYREAELVIFDYLKDTYSNNYTLLAFYDRMIDRYPDKIEWTHQQALFYFKEKIDDFRDIRLYQKVLELEPDSIVLPNIHQKIGILYIKVDSVQRAAESFEKVVQLSPDRIDPVYQLIHLYDRLFQYFDGLPLLEKLNRKKEIDFTNRLLLAEYYSKMGKFKAAEDLLNKAAEMQPMEFVRTNDLYAHLYRMWGKPAKAIEYYKKVFANLRGDYASLYSMARIHAQAGENEKAYAWLEEAFKKGFKHIYVLKYDPIWEQMRNEVAFTDLCSQYGVMWVIHLREPID